MTTATELMHISRNATDALERAEAANTDVTKDWEHEATIFTFEDESVLVVSGPQVNAYADLASAEEALDA